MSRRDSLTFNFPFSTFNSGAARQTLICRVAEQSRYALNMMHLSRVPQVPSHRCPFGGDMTPPWEYVFR